MEERMNITISAQTKKALSQIQQLKAELAALSEKSSIGGLDTMSIKELQNTLKYFQSYGSKAFEKQIKDLQKALELQQKIAGLQTPQAAQGGGVNINKGLIAQIAGGVFAVRSIYLFVRKIASQNEKLTSAINYFFEVVGAVLKPFLDFIANIIMAIAKVLGSFFKVQVQLGKGVSKANKTLSRQLASFDEINNLTRESSGGGIGGTGGWKEVSDTIRSETRPLLEQFREVADATGRKLPPYIEKWAETADYWMYEGWPKFKEQFSEFARLEYRSAEEINQGVESVRQTMIGANTEQKSVLQTMQERINNLQNKAIEQYKKGMSPSYKVELNLDITAGGSTGAVDLNRHSVRFSQIAKLATGGFINDGLFIAGERGPELVGTMGSQSVVANNMQIVEGIKQGVKEALAESQQAISINVDGQTLASVVSRNIQKNKRVMGAG